MTKCEETWFVDVTSKAAEIITNVSLIERDTHMANPAT